jgi:hypothetical protein
MNVVDYQKYLIENDFDYLVWIFYYHLFFDWYQIEMNLIVVFQMFVDLQYYYRENLVYYFDPYSILNSMKMNQLIAVVDFDSQYLKNVIIVHLMMVFDLMLHQIEQVVYVEVLLIFFVVQVKHHLFVDPYQNVHLNLDQLSNDI